MNDVNRGLNGPILGMINQLNNSPQITASGSFLLGNTGPCSGSYLIGQGLMLMQTGGWGKMWGLIFLGLFLRPR